MQLATTYDFFVPLPTFASSNLDPSQGSPRAPLSLTREDKVHCQSLLCLYVTLPNYVMFHANFSAFLDSFKKRYECCNFYTFVFPRITILELSSKMSEQNHINVPDTKDLGGKQGKYGTTEQPKGGSECSQTYI
jgi:hypothetical protein